MQVITHVLRLSHVLQVMNYHAKCLKRLREIALALHLGTKCQRIQQVRACIPERIFLTIHRAAIRQRPGRRRKWIQYGHGPTCRAVIRVTGTRWVEEMVDWARRGQGIFTTTANTDDLPDRPRLPLQ